MKLILFSFLLFSCTIPDNEYRVKNRNEYRAKHNSEIVVIDGCEYVIIERGHGYGMAHKGNCKFCKKELEK